MGNIITYTVNKNFNNALYLSVQNGEVIIKLPGIILKIKYKTL